MKLQIFVLVDWTLFNIFEVVKASHNIIMSPLADVLHAVSCSKRRKIIIIIPHRNHHGAKYGSYYINNERRRAISVIYCTRVLVGSGSLETDGGRHNVHQIHKNCNLGKLKHCFAPKVALIYFHTLRK